MSATDQFLANNAAYAEQFDKGEVPLPPAKQAAVVACMDARIEACPYIPVKDSIRGFVYDVATGRLNEVT